MKKTLFAFIFTSLIFLCNTISVADIQPAENTSWQNALINSVRFFNQFAWDEKSNSYASEINLNGSQRSDTRHLIALSRMVYGLSYSSKWDAANLTKAKKTADFISRKMIRQDSLGSYFISAVKPDGTIVNEKTILDVSEQAYGLNGLVALYNITHEPQLLALIRDLYASFYKRFHDDAMLGFFDGYDLTTQQPIATKSFNSTVYVATSFLIELAEADKAQASSYVATLTELADIIVNHFMDVKTGWIIENFTRDWQPDWRNWQKQGDFTIGIVGHNFQAAWLLMRTADLTKEAKRADTYNNTARTILFSMLEKPVVDWDKGGFFDAFKRETNETMWNNNKAWWQQAEAILALSLAEKNGVLRNKTAALALTKAVEFYFDHFIDKNLGGEFDVVNREGIPVPEAMKGHQGKSTYHAVELARYMLMYHPN